MPDPITLIVLIVLAAFGIGKIARAAEKDTRRDKSREGAHTHEITYQGEVYEPQQQSGQRCASPQCIAARQGGHLTGAFAWNGNEIQSQAEYDAQRIEEIDTRIQELTRKVEQPEEWRQDERIEVPNWPVRVKK